MTECVKNSGTNRILLVNGATTKGGNTDCMEECLQKGIRAAGGRVDAVRLSALTMKYPGCSGCMHCQKHHPSPCVFDDDYGRLAWSVPRYDVLLFVTPCYFHGATAKMRCFLERLYALYDIRGGTNLMSGHRMRWALALNAGDPPEGGLLVTDRAFREEAQYARVPIRSWLVGGTTFGNALPERPDLRDEGVAFGKMLAAWQPEA